MQIAVALVERLRPHGAAVGAREEHPVTVTGPRVAVGRGAGVALRVFKGAETEPLELERRGGGGCARIDT